MTRKLLARSTFLGLAVLLAAALFGETSPWPFPPRPGAASATAAKRSVTVAFWNIQWFPGGRPGAPRAQQIRQTNSVHTDTARLKEADVIGMAEVRNFEQAGVAVKPLAGFKVDVCANFPPREGMNEAQEVAIASRLQPISAWAELWKPSGGVLPPRGFAFAAYELTPRKLLLVYAVHLKSNLGNIKENIAMRQESIAQLHSHMEAMQNAYENLGSITWIIGGDFNTSLNDQQFASETTLRGLMDKGFEWNWRGVPISARITLPPTGDFPPACFDHIFVRGGNIRKAWVVFTSPQSSDHRPAMATIDLPPAAK